MKCPYCGSSYTSNLQYCPNCKQPLSRAPKASSDATVSEAKTPKRPRRSKLQRTLIVLATIICILCILFGIYKLVFWMDNYRINRLYTRGKYTPTIQTITMDDRRQGHSIVFYGEDGDQIYLPETQESVSISGGTARVALADADWFEGDVLDIEAANVSLSPILISEKGERTQLPLINFTVDVPDSPLTIISPEKSDLTIVTALYLLELQVVPGSTVLVNGEDVTDLVDRSGLLSKNVNVYPIGDNIFTVIVRTPKHHETRQDIVIHREKYDIDFELSPSVKSQSSNKTMTISGTIEPGAWMTVETAYIENSLALDTTTGEFQFITQLSNFGSNTVRFRISMEGRQDAVISLNVDYKPTLAEYSAQAWKMDYVQLRQLYEQWSGQVFKCVGPILDIVHDGDNTYYIMDVSTDEIQQLVVLLNQSSLDSPSLGSSYTGYAHVSGRYMYNSQYYPMLTCLYLDHTKVD